MKDRIIQTLILLYNFVKKPFNKSIENIDNDRSLVFIASVLSGLFVISRFLFTSQDIFSNIIFLILGLLLTPVFGVLIVRIKGTIFDFYLKYIASRIVNYPLNDVLNAKKIATFSSIGLIVSGFPFFAGMSVIVGLIIEVLGLQRLFKIELKKAIIVSLLYHVIYFAASWVIKILLFF